MKKLIMFASVGVLFLFGNQTTVNAEEISYDIYPTTQEKISKAIEQDKGNENYINGIIELFKTDIKGSSEELNELLLDSIEQAETTSNEIEQEKNLIDELQESTNQNKQNRAINPVEAARAAYTAGMLLVKAKGHPQTAKYMNYALTPNSKLLDLNWTPADYISNNDAWAKKVATYEGINAAVYLKFYNEIIGKGKSYGTVSGSYQFTAGELHTSLNKVKYNVTFTKLSSGGYKAVYKITDAFDFAWDGQYDDIAVGFGNNYCFAMQKLTLIRKYNIVINYTM